MVAGYRHCDRLHWANLLADPAAHTEIRMDNRIELPVQRNGFAVNGTPLVACTTQDAIIGKAETGIYLCDAHLDLGLRSNGRKGLSRTNLNAGKIITEIARFFSRENEGGSAT